MYGTALTVQNGSVQLYSVYAAEVKRPHVNTFSCMLLTDSLGVFKLNKLIMTVYDLEPFCEKPGTRVDFCKMFVSFLRDKILQTIPLFCFRIARLLLQTRL